MGYRSGMADLDRFKDAQAQRGAGFDAALSEIQAGRKRGHWIWYVFPQLAGLGASPLAQAYGIGGGEEATAYLCDPVLRERLLAIATAAADRLRDGIGLTTLMGSHIDALKLVSSMTLFGAVARAMSASDADYRLLADVAEKILAAAESQGFARCQFTLAHVAHEK